MSIALLIGPMRSGKTFKMLAKMNQYERNGNDIIAIKPKRDTRLSDDYICAQNKSLKRIAIKANSISEIYDQVEHYVFVAIDDGLGVRPRQRGFEEWDGHKLRTEH